MHLSADKKIIITFVTNKVPPLETVAELMAALWEVFLFCKYKVSDYSLAFCFYMRPLHNTALAALLLTFRPRHLQE